MLVNIVFHSHATIFELASTQRHMANYIYICQDGDSMCSCIHEQILWYFYTMVLLYYWYFYTTGTSILWYFGDLLVYLHVYQMFFEC